MYRDLYVAVVMPAYNEASHILQAVRAVPEFVDRIVVVDDASTDGTGEALFDLADPRLTVVRHEKNLGVGAATKTGYRLCLQSEADVIAVMDGDGQMDGRDLSLLLDRIAAGADYVRGNRFLHTESLPGMPVTRYLGNRLFSFLTRRAASFNGSLDAQCGYSAIRRGALERLDLDSMYDRYGFPNEMFFAAVRAGLIMESVPVRVIYGDEVSHINPLTVVPTVMYLIGRQRLRFSRSRRTAIASEPVDTAAQAGLSGVTN